MRYLIFALLLTGCSINDPTAGINRLKRPVTVVATNSGGGVLVRGSDGTLYLVTYDTYLGAALRDVRPGDVLVPEVTK